MILKESTIYSKGNMYHVQPTVKLNRHTDNWAINQYNKNTPINERVDKICRQIFLNCYYKWYEI